MKIFQSYWNPSSDWSPKLPVVADSTDLLLVFGGSQYFKNPAMLNTLRDHYPKAYLFACSTAGEICDTRVYDDSMVLTAVRFEKTKTQGVAIRIQDSAESFEAGKKLAGMLDKNGLTHVFVLSNGLKINGSDLVKGISSVLPEGVAVTGGLSGDGSRFQETFVAAGDISGNDVIGAVGLYGDCIKIGYGSLGGWDPFGPERLITRSTANVLYELDGRSALELYKKYLGEYAHGLPATGLLFPLSLRVNDGDPAVVRTILSVNEKDHSLTFAGNVPEGSKARLMKANFDRLIDGAGGAAKSSLDPLNSSPDLAVLISCVGRKLILKQRVEEEVEAVREILGAKPIMTGFYSYGEISPFTPSAKCELHNQTMTITTFREI